MHVQDDAADEQECHGPCYQGLFIICIMMCAKDMFEISKCAQSPVCAGVVGGGDVEGDMVVEGNMVVEGRIVVVATGTLVQGCAVGKTANTLRKQFSRFRNVFY